MHWGYTHPVPCSGGGTIKLSNFRELLRLLEEKYSEIHDVFVLALLFSTVISGIYWVAVHIFIHASQEPPLELTAMTLFLLAFTASFYTGKIKKNVLSAFLGILLFAALIGKLGHKIIVEGMTEENLLLTASFIFGATGSFLYRMEELMKKLEALFLLLIAALIIVIFLLSF